MAVTVEPVFPPQVLTWEELPLLTVEAELPHWEGKRAFCRYYAAWGRGLLDYGRRVLLPQLAERCRRALEQGGMLPLTTAALRSRIVRDGAWCEHLHGAHGAVAVPLPGRCVGGGTAGGGGGVLPAPYAVAPPSAGDGARAGAGPAPRRFLVGGGGTAPAGEPSQRGIRGGVFALRPGAGAAGSTWAVMGRQRLHERVY